MNVDRKVRCIIFLVTTFTAATASGYPEKTHQKMTELAYKASIMDQYPVRDAMLLSGYSLGGNPPPWYVVDYDGERLAPGAATALGALQEDAKFPYLRFTRHFYNVQQGGAPLWIVEENSPTWALEADDDIFVQKYSYRDFKDYLWNALLEEDFDERSHQFYLAFRSLGHVLHHVEDMGQPQHVRGDVHCDSLVCILGAYDPSDYEELSGDVFDGRVLGEFYLSKDISPIRLPSAISYWGGVAIGDDDPDVGMATYSSFNFVSEETNFLFNSESGGVSSPADQPLPNAATGRFVAVPASKFYPESDDLSIKVFQTPVTDPLLGAGPQYTHDTATLSFIPVFIGPTGVDRDYRFQLYDGNYLSAQHHLVPRLLNMTAGFIDKTFGGRISVRPPKQGHLAVMDHGTTKEFDDGFERLKVTVTNITAPIEVQGVKYPQDFGGGELVAVASYRKNYCYDPNMEFSKIRECSTYDSQEKSFELSVSKPINIGNWTRGEKLEIELDFSEDPIPISAHDLYLSVYYRGGIGTEEDMIAVGSMDVSEPTFATFFNSTDHYFYNDRWYDLGDSSDVAYLEDQFDSLIDYESENIAITAISSRYKTIPVNDSIVPPGGVARFALLASAGSSIDLSIEYEYERSGSDQSFRIFPAYTYHRYRYPTVIATADQVRELAVYYSLSVFKMSGDVEPDYNDIYNLPRVKSVIANPLDFEY